MFRIMALLIGLVSFFGGVVLAMASSSASVGVWLGGLGLIGLLYYLDKINANLAEIRKHLAKGCSIKPLEDEEEGSRLTKEKS